MADWKELSEYELPAGYEVLEEHPYSEDELGTAGAKAAGEAKIDELKDTYGPDIDSPDGLEGPNVVTKVIRVIRDVAGVIYYVVLLVLIAIVGA